MNETRRKPAGEGRRIEQASLSLGIPVETGIISLLGEAGALEREALPAAAAVLALPISGGERGSGFAQVLYVMGACAGQELRRAHRPKARIGRGAV